MLKSGSDMMAAWVDGDRAGRAMMAWNWKWPPRSKTVVPLIISRIVYHLAVVFAKLVGGALSEPGKMENMLITYSI